MKILLVDDEPIVREGLKNGVDWNDMELQLVGCEANGQDALKTFIQEGADIVLTDIRMPFMDGLQLTREIKILDSTTIVILLSAYDDFKYAQQAIKLGAFDYILKPIDIQLLKLTIKKAISERKKILEKEKNTLPSLQERDLKFFNSQYFKNSLELETELIKALKRGDSETSVKTLNTIWNQFNIINYSIDFKKRWSLELIATITRVLIDIGENADVLFKETDPWKQICDKSTDDKLYNWIKSIIEVVCEYISISKNSKNRKLIDLAIQMIEENYSDLHISLNSIADKLYISPNYLSTLFKSEIGITFSEYLTSYRIEKAKTLLKDVKVKIYEVAEAVGYNDQHYFTKVFKNFTGMTPKEFKERN